MCLQPRAKSSRARNHEAAVPSSRQEDNDGDLEMGAEDGLELEVESVDEDGMVDGVASASGVSHRGSKLISRMLWLK